MKWSSIAELGRLKLILLQGQRLHMPVMRLLSAKLASRRTQPSSR